MYYNYILLDQRYPGTWEIENNIIVSYKPFYVGKGKGRRVKAHFQKSAAKHDGNKHKINTINAIINEVGEFPKYVILYNTEYEQESLDNEVRLIRTIKEKYEGILTNILDGGDQPPILRGADNPCSKKVYQFTMDGVFIKVFDCIADAARELNIRASHISSCCILNKVGKPQRYSCGNYRWSFTDQPFDLAEGGKFMRLPKGKIVGYNSTETLEFNSLAEAYKYLKQKNKGHITKCIKNPEKTYLGYNWKLK